MFRFVFLIACCIWTVSARSIADIQPTMHLYTKANPSNGRLLTRNFIPSVFDASKMTVFVVHGWYNGGTTQWLHDVKNGLLRKTVGYNVIIVGWEKGSKNLLYLPSVADARLVGNEIGLVAANLNIPRSRLYCIGHSLGAHVCGFAGMTKKFGRITGLDPAGPLINFNILTDRLNPTCADFVDVIHTDGNHLGTMTTLGHVDFYPNGGKRMPGCLLLGLVACSHSRAIKYFIESIQNPCFASRDKCNDQNKLSSSCSWTPMDQNMGLQSNEFRGRGIFYLKTNKRAPYCLG